MPTEGNVGIAVTATKRIPVSDLKTFPGNARRGDVPAIVKSLRAHGQFRALVVRASTLEVLAGNHTLLALRELGTQDALCHLVDVDAEQAKRIVLADNRTNDLATYDNQALADLLVDLTVFDGTGFEQQDVDRLLAELAPSKAGDDTDPGEPPIEPVTKLGDLIVLGDHRLLCGDATKAEDVERLMGSDKAEMVFTDPPYGIAYQDVKRHYRPMVGDEADPEELIVDALREARFNEGAAIYVCCDWRSLGTMSNALRRNDREPKAVIVWDKAHGVQNLDRYFKQHEFLLYAGPYGGEPTIRGDVWQISREPNHGAHPTPKPVGLIETALLDAAAGTVVDPFAGSGSTLIAAENLGRACYAIEIDPAYCDVTVDRWERHTGQTAVRPNEADAKHAPAAQQTQHVAST